MHSSVINYLCERLIDYCNYSKHKKQFIVGICMVNINKIIINDSYCSLYQINNINSLSLAMLVVCPMSGVYIKAYCHNYIKLQIRGGELSIYWTWKGHKFYPSWEMRHMYSLSWWKSAKNVSAIFSSNWWKICILLDIFEKLVKSSVSFW